MEKIMKLDGKDFYNLCSNNNFREIVEKIEDGYSGMFYILKILSEAKEELTAGDVTNKFGTSTARTAVALTNLEKKGYITRTKSESDQRQTIVKITGDGLIALNSRKNELFSNINRYLEKLSTKEQKQLYQILQKLIAK